MIDDHCDVNGGLRLTNWEPDTLTMEELAGHYVWKHDGQHVSGDMTLLADGTLEQYWPQLAGSTWFISDADEVVLTWPWNHVLTRDPNSKDWFMNSRNPPSKLEWVGPLSTDTSCPYADNTVEVCKKMAVKGRDIPEGYRAMSQQDVTDNWNACIYAMGAWDIIALADGSVDGHGYGNKLHNGREVQCDANRWTFVMTDSDCSNDLVCVY